MLAENSRASRLEMADDAVSNLCDVPVLQCAYGLPTRNGHAGILQTRAVQ